MYIRRVKRKNKDGTEVTYYQVVRSFRHPDSGKPRTEVLMGLGRADRLDRAALQRLAGELSALLYEDPAAQGIDMDELDVEVARSCSLGVHGVVRKMFAHLDVEVGGDEALRHTLADAVSRRIIRISAGGIVDASRQGLPDLATALLDDVDHEQTLVPHLPHLGDATTRAVLAAGTAPRRALVTAQRRRNLAPQGLPPSMSTALLDFPRWELQDGCWLTTDTPREDDDLFVIVTSPDAILLGVRVLSPDTPPHEGLALGAEIARSHGIDDVIQLQWSHEPRDPQAAHDDLTVACRAVPGLPLHDELLAAPGRYRHVRPGLKVKELPERDGFRQILVRSDVVAERDDRMRDTALDLSRERHEPHTLPCRACEPSQCAVGRYLLTAHGREAWWDPRQATRADGATVLTTRHPEVSPEELVLMARASSRTQAVLERMMPTGHTADRPVHDASLGLSHAALVLMRWVSQRAGMPLTRVAETLSTVQQLDLRVGKQRVMARSPLTPDQQRCLRALGLAWTPCEDPAEENGRTT